MRKLFVLLTSLLCCFALAVPVFADLIVPPEQWETGTIQISEETSEAVSDLSSAAPDRTALFLVIGAVVVAAGLALWLLLRKREK